MERNKHKHIVLSLVTIAILSGCGSSSSLDTNSTNSSTNSIATSIPTITSTPTSADSVVPKKPTVSNVPKSTTENSIVIEIQGEIDTSVWVDGEEVGTMGSDGKLKITLDMSGKKGSKTFSIVLKNTDGKASEALVIVVEKEDIPIVSTTSSTGVIYTTPVVAVQRKGTLIDSFLENIHFSCGTKTGVTDENGTFECSSTPIVFKTADGKLEIGRRTSFTLDNRVYLQDLLGLPRHNVTDPRLILLSSFLLALDDDGNYTERITIDDSALVLANAIKFSDMNRSTVEKLLTDGGLNLVSEEDVVLHLIENAHEDVNKTIEKDTYFVFLDKKALTISSTDVTESLIFPTLGEKGSTYSYVSSHESILSNVGVVNRKSYTEGNTSVKIIGTITKGTVSDTKEFLLNVLSLPITDLESITLAKDELGIDATLSAIDGNIVLVTSSIHGVTVSWESSNSAISTSGIVTRPSFTVGNVPTELIATLTKGSESITKVFNLTILKLAITDAEIVTNVKFALDLGDTSSLSSNLTLPTLIDSVAIVWSSSSDAIGSDGVINPDNYQGVDKTATLVATLTLNGVTETKEFTVVVPKLLITDAEKVAEDKVGLNFGIYGDDLFSITSNLNLPTIGTNQASVVSWSSSDKNFLSDLGVITRPSYSLGDKQVIIVATITNGTASDTKEFTMFIKRLDMTGDEKIADAFNRITYDDIKGNNSAENNIISNLILPTNLIVDNGSNVLIKWSSTPALIDSDGTIHSPSFTNGNANVSLIGTIGVPSSTNPNEFDGASATVTKQFDLILVALDMSDGEAVALAKVDLDLGDTSNIIENLILASTGLHGTSITYSSSNQSVLSNSGTVTRPNFGDGDATVTLTATITKNGVSDTKSFTVVVKEKELNLPGV